MLRQKVPKTSRAGLKTKVQPKQHKKRTKRTTTHRKFTTATISNVDKLDQTPANTAAQLTTPATTTDKKSRNKKPSKNRYKKFVTNPERQILSGIQPTGVVHIGNLFGAISNWVSLQYTEPLLKQQQLIETLLEQRQLVKTGQQESIIFKPQPHKPVLYTVVDLHAITIPKSAEELDVAIRNLTATLIGCGIDPDYSNLFIQSHVRQHTELAWLLTCNTPVSWLYRMTQFKDKSSKLEKQTEDGTPITNDEDTPLSQLPRGVMAGLLQYPALMAADILLYNATHVPVGDDQTQHLEFARELARTMNSQYSPIFVEPHPIHNPYATRVMSLRSPENKMSKSDPSEGGKITLQDTDKEIITKIQRAVTDNNGGVTYDPTRPGLQNLLDIYAATENMKYLTQFHQQTNQLLNNTFFQQNNMTAHKNNKANFDEIATNLFNFANSTLTTQNGVEDQFEIAAKEWLDVVNRPKQLVSPSDLAAKHATDQLSVFKPAVSESLVGLIAPIREKTNQVLKDESYMTDVVTRGANTARGIAENTVMRTKDVMGMRF